MCRASDCWCQCSPGFPQCNCPRTDLQALQINMQRMQEAWTLANLEFEESGVCLVGNSNTTLCLGYLSRIVCQLVIIVFISMQK